MNKIFLAVVASLLLPGLASAANITYADKVSGGSFSAADANEIKTAVNSKANLAAITWVTATAYTANNQSVTHGGHVFVCTSNHTSGATTEPGTGVDWETVWKYHGSDLYAAALGADDNYVTVAEKTRLGDLQAADSVSFAEVTATGAGGLKAGTEGVTRGAITLYSNANPFAVGINSAATPTQTWTLTLPPAAPAGANYLFNVDADGTGGFTDPATLGGDDLGSAAYTDVVSLWTTCAGYLKSDGTCDSPTGTGDMVLADTQTVTGLKTFDTTKLAVKGLSTGTTAFENTNNTATNYTLTLPNASGTLARLADITAGSGDMLLGTPQNVTALKMFDPSTFGIKGSSTGTTTFSSANDGATSYALVFPAADGTLARLSDIPGSATGLPFTPAGTIAATTTQAAIEEVSGDIEALPTLTIQTTAITTGANNILGSDYGLIADTDGDGLPNKVDLAAAGTVQVDSNGVVSSVAFASSSDINTGTDTTKPVTADALSGSNLGIEPVGWMIKNSATATAVADGTEAFVVPAAMNGRNLVDVTAATASPNGGTGGSTTVVIRRVRTTAAMGDATSQYDLTFSTPNVTITWDGTGTDPGIVNTAASLQAGDEVDITGFATAANNGHWTIATVGTNYITFANAAGVENLDDIGVTITPTKHRDMTSTGATVAYTEYSASDETVDTGYDDIATGDRIYVDVTGITTTAGAKGLSVTSSFQLP